MNGVGTMDKCSLCGRQLMVGRGESTTTKDSLAVYRELALVCTNPDCANFAGNDTSKPNKVVSVKKIPENKYARDEICLLESKRSQG